MPLHPEKTISRFLLSSAARITGQFETEDLCVSYAFGFGKLAARVQMEPGPLSRTHFVLSVAHDEPDGSIVIPSYLINAHLIADLAAVWFGKRFDVHGALQEYGVFSIPSTLYLEPLVHPLAGPFNHRPRRDLNIELTWGAFAPVFELFRLYEKKESLILAFWNAARFYARGLRAFDIDPEVAFLEFVIAMEILSAHMQFADDQLFDNDSLSLFKRIREELKDGEKLERAVRDRFFQLRRKISLTAVALTNDQFFGGSEAQHTQSGLSRENLASHVKAAYDIRSSYAHAGFDFGAWVNFWAESNEEVQFGTPVLDDRDAGKLISKAPTLIGLERLTRFMILRFAHTRIVPIHVLLD